MGRVALLVAGIAGMSRRSLVGHRRRERAGPSVAEPRSPVRVLRDDHEVQQAVARAADFERQLIARVGARVATYEATFQATYQELAKVPGLAVLSDAPTASPATAAEPGAALGPGRPAARPPAAQACSA